MRGAALAWLAPLLLALALMLAPAGAGWTQESLATAAGTGDGIAQAGPNYEAWAEEAKRADATLEENLASISALEEMRRSLVDWRAQFQAATGANQARVDTVKAQIEALGPAPEAGSAEPGEVATRRADLSQELARLEAPRRTANEAYSLADSLIRQVDTEIRARQTGALMRLGPSPINPANWPGAFDELRDWGGRVIDELGQAWSSEARRAEMASQLPIALLLAAIGLVALLRGEVWSDRLSSWAWRRFKPATAGAVDFAFSLGQVLFPFIGAVAIWRAVERLDMLGAHSEAAWKTLPVLALSVAGMRWIGLRMFPVTERGTEVLSLPPERRAEGRLYSLVTGVALWAIVLARSVGTFENWQPATMAVVQFPILILAALCLGRVGQLIARQRPGEEGESANFFSRKLATAAGRIAMALAAAGPVLAAIGYSSAASFVTLPAVVSLALLGLLVLVQTFFTELYAVATGRSVEETADALAPVLFGLVLGLAALPVFALVWGARVADLTELWTRINDGFVVGDTRISPSQFLTFAVVFALVFGLTRLVQGVMRSTVLPKTRIDPGGQNAMIVGIGYVGIALAGVLAITATGLDLSNIALVFGALSVGIGFGLQNIVQNFISGIIMLIERPVAEGDWVEVGGKMGIVRGISVRSTRVETFDRTEVIVPNGEFITGIVTNWTRGNLTGRVIVTVGVAYGTDTRRVEAILREIAEAHPLVTLNPAPAIIFAGFGADSLDFEIRAIIRDVNFGLATKSDMHHEIARRFAEEGIEIPFAQRDLWLRNPESLQRAFVKRRAAPPASSEPVRVEQSSGEAAEDDPT